MQNGRRESKRMAGSMEGRGHSSRAGRHEGGRTTGQGGRRWQATRDAPSNLPRLHPIHTSHHQTPLSECPLCLLVPFASFSIHPLSPTPSPGSRRRPYKLSHLVPSTNPVPTHLAPSSHPCLAPYSPLFTLTGYFLPVFPTLTSPMLPLPTFSPNPSPFTDPPT